MYTSPPLLPYEPFQAGIQAMSINNCAASQPLVPSPPVYAFAGWYVCQTVVRSHCQHAIHFHCSVNHTLNPLPVLSPPPFCVFTLLVRTHHPKPTTRYNPTSPNPTATTPPNHPLHSPTRAKQ